MAKSTDNLTLEQQELLDSGLRMLAHMIVETHLRRAAPNKNRRVTANTKHHSVSQETAEESPTGIQSESTHE